MNYIGKLYGHLGNGLYFDTGKTSEDWDNLEKKVAELEAQIKSIKESATDNSFCVHDFVEKDSYWKACKKCGKIVPFGQ
jgi:hypothetical protein